MKQSNDLAMMWLLLYVSLLTTLAFSQRLTEKENEHLQKICGKPAQSDHPVRRSMHTPQVARAAAPWVVRMEKTKNWFPNMTIEDRKNSSAGACSGSLISPRHVLTAAHCVVMVQATCTPSGDVLSTVYPEVNVGRMTVRFTESCKLDSCKWGGSFKDIHVPVKKAFVAKSWTGTECLNIDTIYRGDVAVLELAEEIPYSSHVFPACLNSWDVKIFDDIEQFGFGYGPNTTDSDFDTDELRHFKGFVVPCDFVAPDVFCFFNPITSLCMGDSGSGLYVYDEDKRVNIVGPLSGGFGQCHEKLDDQKKQPSPGIQTFATLVKSNLFWICAATGICLNDDAKEYKIYNDKGLAEFWYKTFEPLTGNGVFI